MSDLTPEALAPLLYLAYVTGMHEAALQSPAARAAALASVNGFSVIAREYRAGWTAAATEAHARLAPAHAALTAERDAALAQLAEMREKFWAEGDEAATQRISRHVAETENDRFRATLEEIRDSSAASTLTLQAIAVKGLEGGRG